MKKEDLKRAFDNIQITSDAENRTLQTALETKNTYKKEITQMSRKKIFAAAAAAAALVLGFSVFASSGAIKNWNGSSSSVPTYTSIPSAEQCEKDAGFVPDIIEEFSNGYSFKNCTIVKNSLTDESDTVVEKFKSFSFRYDKGDETIDFDAMPYVPQPDELDEPTHVINNINLYYSSYTNKLVPPDYELTEEDKRAQESGELVFSYGTDDVEISEVKTLIWNRDGIHYLLQQHDGELTADDFVQMAGEIISK